MCYCILLLLLLRTAAAAYFTIWQQTLKNHTSGTEQVIHPKYFCGER
jgi:hypothetical protein